MPSEYVSSGRYFQSIEMSEGEDVTMSVIDLLGEDILMYASDYPHSESWFPISVELVIGWTRIPESAKMKLFWAACSSSYISGGWPVSTGTLGSPGAAP